MISPKGKVYFVGESMDMRGGVDKLCGILVEKFGLNPSLGNGYIFVNREKNKLKAIFFHGNGFVVLYKRLEECRFQVGNEGDYWSKYPKDHQGKMIVLSDLEVNLLFCGLDIKKFKIPKERTYEIF
jgi:transposase